MASLSGKSEPLLMANVTGSQYNLVGVELGGGWGKAISGWHSSETKGVFASIEPGMKGCTLRSGWAYLGGGDMAMAVGRMEVVGVADHWSELPNRWGPEATVGLNLLLARFGVVFGRPATVDFQWGLGVGF